MKGNEHIFTKGLTLYIMHVLAGAYPLLQFRLVSGQAARRGTDLHFPRYQLSNQEDCSAFQGALLALLKPACRAVSGREAKTAELQRLMDHWPLFYAGCLGCVGVLKEWLIRAVSAALRKGDAQLTLERVREYELIEARRSQMATDIVAGEQQVAFTGDAHTHLNSLLQMEPEAGSPPVQSAEAGSASPRRTNTRPGTRKSKRDPVGDHLNAEQR